MMRQDNSYDRYLIDDNFFYDEQSSKKGQFLKQDTELFNEDDDIPGDSIRVKRNSRQKQEDWVVWVNKKEYLTLKGTRFSVRERKFLRSADGVLFIISGVKNGWKSVSEFKRQLALHCVL